MLVTIFLLCGVSITLDVEPSDTIENVKAKIQDRSGVRKDHIELFFEGSALLNDRTVSYYRQAFSGLAYFCEGREIWGWFDDPRVNGAVDEDDWDDMDDDRPNLIQINARLGRRQTAQKIFCFYSC